MILSGQLFIPRKLEGEAVMGSKKKRKSLRIVMGMIVAVFFVGIVGFLYISFLLQPVDRTDTRMIEVDIPLGSSVSTIARTLSEHDLIRNEKVFEYYVRLQNEHHLQAGTYELSKSMTVPDIITELTEGRRPLNPAITFTIPEGSNFERIVAIIAEATNFDEEEIKETLTDESIVKKFISKHEILTEEILAEDVRYPLEGYLFPMRYDFYDKDITIEEIVDTMIAQMEHVLFSQKTTRIKKRYSYHEILTLASIVEREAKEQEDRPLIAGVLFNRLKEGMRLAVDPTVAYALGEHRYMTSLQDLEVDSPYNTYMYEGLPPGPIASPGEKAIAAVLSPKESDYLFFYARPNGEVIYNETYEKHRKVQEKYRSEWEEGRPNDE